MNSSQLRKAFLDYFHQHGHTVVNSAPLVPANDPSLLFTNAGMVQFKDTLLGKEPRSYSKAVSVQRCVRAGGKHNDLENVGYTARHHTFFEMLGNFSFGDYFKVEAINYAWDFLTKVLKLPEEKLWVTVYQDDDEAEAIWLEDIKVSPKRFSRCGDKDNFWSMGDTGPCGPCTEIFYDHGPHIAGGPPGSPEQEGDRYIEIWNLVFMQYNRAVDGSLSPLSRPAVDTGMGLERTAAILQGVDNNYDIDLFAKLISSIAKLANTSDKQQASLRVIADHIRSSAFLVVDGVRPSNEGRGYVLRRIIRRAIRHGHKIGIKETFFYQLVAPLVALMGDAYPELTKAQAVVEKILRYEEQQFSKTLDAGLKILRQHIAKLASDTIPGDLVFQLYDTYGFPVDLTADYAREQGLTLDYPGYEQAMAMQRAQSQRASQFTIDDGKDLLVQGETAFTGYEHLTGNSSVVKLFVDGNEVKEIHSGSKASCVLTATPFYAEAGGQVGDRGVITNNGTIFEVHDTSKQQNVHIHHGVLQQGVLAVGDSVCATVNEQIRQATRLNHSATHLLHAALREILGDHVVQKGSLVNEHKLRFDFTHFAMVDSKQCAAIEALVNQQVRTNSKVITTQTTMADALAKGAMALFGEKYGDHVRVLSMGGEFSVELCGGTHVANTGDIGLFKIISESAIAAGVRRIEAVTGEQALQWLQQQDEILSGATSMLNAAPQELLSKIKQLLMQTKQLEKKLQQTKQQVAEYASADLLQQVRVIHGVNVLVGSLDYLDPKALRSEVEKLKGKLNTAVICLATIYNDKISIVSGVTKNNTSRIDAVDLVNVAARLVGGKGGGRADIAQAGGSRLEQLELALQEANTWIEQRLVSR